MGVTDDTWGISGPVFLTAYLVVALMIFVAGDRTRRALADPRPDRPWGDLAAHPHALALLNGGRELAVFSALAALRTGGGLAPAGRGLVRSSGRPPIGSGDLEHAVHEATAEPVARRGLHHDGTVASSLRRLEDDLVAAGLLLSPERRFRMRATGWWLLALGAVGVVRIVSGAVAGKPVGFLLAATAVVTVIGVVNVVRVPRRSRSGDAELARIRGEQYALSPSQRPDWTAYGPAGAALGVGLFGVGALWASDPAFAAEVEAQQAGRAAASGAGSSGCGGASSGCGGGGGGCGGGCGG